MSPPMKGRSVCLILRESPRAGRWFPPCSFWFHCACASVYVPVHICVAYACLRVHVCVSVHGHGSPCGCVCVLTCGPGGPSTPLTGWSSRCRWLGGIPGP